MEKLFFKRASWALAVLLSTSVIVVGCKKEEPIDPSSPASYMQDKAFLKKLDDRDQAKRDVMRKHSKLKAQYAVASTNAPDAAETKALKAAMDDCAAEFERLRKESMKIVSERLAPKKNPQK